MARKTKTTITPPGVTAAGADLEATQDRLGELRPALAQVRRSLAQAVSAKAAGRGSPRMQWDGDAPGPDEDTPAELQPADIAALQARASDLKDRIDNQVERCAILGREEAREVAAAARPQYLANQQKLADMLVEIGLHADAMFAHRSGLLDHCGEPAVADSFLASALPLPVVRDLMLSRNNSRLNGWLSDLERMGCDVPAERGINERGIRV